HPESPYLQLLRQAGIDYDACARLVTDRGIEGALAHLYDAGVHIKLDEFKGRRSIVRGGLTIPAAARDFDNPLPAGHFEARTGGSRSPGSRLIIDLEVLAHDAHYDVLFFDMFGLNARPCALWHPAPPGAAGLKWALRL